MKTNLVGAHAGDCASASFAILVALLALVIILLFTAPLGMRNDPV